MNRACVNRRLSTIIALVVAACVAPGALGQLVPPAPPADKPRPEWTPPAPPPEPAPAAAPEKVPPQPEPIAVPDIVKRDAQGAAIVLDVPQERVAMEALELSSEQRALFETAKAERSALYQHFLVQNLDAALKVRAGVAKFAAGDTSSALDLLTMAKRIQVIPNYIKSMEAAGVLDARHALAATRASDAYSAAISRDLKKRVDGEDVSGQMQTITSATIRRIATEPILELNALLARASEQWATLTAVSSLTPINATAFQTAQAAVANAADPASRADAVAAALALLPSAQAQDLLTRALPALPEKRLLPELKSSMPKDGSKPATKPSAKVTKPAG